ncbi:MAG: hypothetical protein K2X27_17585 [Candidatus Obscuribacterales bacterium]|nr:hypothetical protein [Candidatus Obscuribacterales bacterium]
MFTIRQTMHAPEQIESPKNSYKTFQDYSELYWESTQETLISLYALRDPQTGQPVENINDIIHRVAYANAVAELKYALSPLELVTLSYEEAVNHPTVVDWAKVFADNIGKQRFWVNTPGNINASPEISLRVLKYWAHGQLAGMKEEDIWLRSEELAKLAKSSGNKKLAESKGKNLEHELSMGKLALELKGKGCLAACGVAFVEDSLEGIQETAKIEALAAKAAMGMGLNTSSLRPWSSIISNGAAASGPDRFYEKSIAKAVEAVAQGGRRGGALIELRNSDHPDILFFIEKKRLIPRPSLAQIFKVLRSQMKQLPGEANMDYKKRLLVEAEHRFGQHYAEYIEKQNYLKNTNITVLAMPGFMDAVRDGLFYQARFNGQNWNGPVYDPRKPVRDEKSGLVKVNKLSKELIFEEYSVDLNLYPEAREAARKLDRAQVELSENEIKVHGHFYAPEIFQRIIDGMQSSGEPGIAFFDRVNQANANDHIYELNTCNPCGEQFLPAGRGFDGRVYMGTCNLSSMHAAHREFWNEDGSYNMQRMKDIARIMQRFMDNVSDVSWYPLPAQNMTTRLERRNGGGFAGVAEYLSRLGLEFGEPMALSSVEELYRQFTRASVEASEQLAKERGVYPLWEGSRFARKGLAVRNSCMTNNAPTGTLAQALQTSWGVDPHNGIVFSRKVRSRLVNFVAPGFREAMEKHKAWPADEAEQNALMQAIRENHKSCRNLAVIPQEVQNAFPVRVEIEPEKYIKHLAAIHKGADEYPEAFNSVSNTCSIPADMSDQSIGEAVLLAYELGVKDLTFYPDGSRLSQPVEQIAARRFEQEQEADLLSLLGHQEQRPINIEETSGLTYKVRVGSPGGGSTLHVSLNHEVEHPGELVEVYARMGKPGAIEAGLFEAVGRLASAFLQYAAQFGEAERSLAEQTIVQQLINIQSGYPAFFKFSDAAKPTVIQSPCDGLAKAILEYRKGFSKVNRYLPSSSELDTTGGGETIENSYLDEEEQKLGFCSHCGQDDWIKADGCFVCQSCGYSKCG